MSRVSRQWTSADSAARSQLFFEVLELEERGHPVPPVMRLRLGRLTGRYVRHLRATLGPRRAVRRRLW